MLKNDEAVIGGIGNANFDLWESGQRPQNFYMLGSMGLAIPIALGLAIAQPKRHVVALEGDGSLLMQLGCLATVACRRRKISPSWCGTTASTRSPARSRPRAPRPPISSPSRAAPALPTAWAADEDEFDRLFAQALNGGGPTLIAARIDGEPGVANTDRDPVHIRADLCLGWASSGREGARYFASVTVSNSAGSTISSNSQSSE